MNTIIKAQKSLSGDGKILIYNKNRSIYQEMTDSVLLTAIGDRTKAYFEVNIGDDGIMKLIREIKRNW